MENFQHEDDYKFLKVIQDAIRKAKKEEAEKWKAKIQELKEQTNNHEWVDRKTAMKLVKVKQVNTLKEWIRKGIIQEGKKIGGAWHYKKSNLLKLWEDESEEQ